MNELTLLANAKINLTLGITGKRENGYHEIDTIMQSVGLSDTVCIKKSTLTQVKCSLPDISGESNIACKAAELFFEKTGVKGHARIEIEKNIPVCAGLGGGSADAAAVLIGLNKIFETNLEKSQLCGIAARLGADVPFFILGGTVRATGIGEVLSKQADLKSGYFVLAKSGEKPSTAEMYKKLDSAKFILPDTEKALKAIENDDILSLSECFNNSFAILWENDKAKSGLKKTDAIGISLSGSGPVWFGFYDCFEKAERALTVLNSEKISCWLAEPCNYSIKIV